MPRRVTLQDIARRLGVHQTSISRALADSPKISPEMRERIKSTAREMGYRPDPVAKALAAHRASVRPVGEYGTLAWITFGKFPVFSAPDYVFADYVKGAAARAAELGFRLEEFPHRANGMTDARLSRILKNRGIRGVLVGPLSLEVRSLRRLRLDWKSFSAVSFGHNLLWPALSRVSHNQFRGMRTIVRKLHALGYRRIGAYLPRHSVDDLWEAGFYIETRNRQVRGFFLAHDQGRYCQNQLAEWIRRKRLDAVIVSFDAGEHPLGSAFRVPEEVGVAACHVFSRNSQAAGIFQNFVYTGARAVDLLVSFLHANQRGIPEFPERVLIEGEWVKGKTLRR